MKRKINKVIEVTPMTRQEAEMNLCEPINNLLHGDAGYLLESNKWVPATIVDKNSVRFETHKERTLFLLKEIKDYVEYINNKEYRSQALTVKIKNELKKLIREL